MANAKTEWRIKRVENWLRNVLLETDEEVIQYTARRMREDDEVEHFWIEEMQRGRVAVRES